jgi:hypothetical protein
MYRGDERDWTAAQNATPPPGRRERRIAVHAAPRLRRAALPCDAHGLGCLPLGDVHRFEDSRSWVSYLGLNPSEDSL